MTTSVDKQMRDISWVNISKGIVICLMVIGHSSIPAPISRWIYSFHMPFFFFISALFTNWDKGTKEQFIIRKAKILLIPFVIYSLINIIIYPVSLEISHLQYIEQVVSNGWEGIALWFIPVFYTSLVICRLIDKSHCVVIGFMLLVLGALLSYSQIILPWTISTIPFASAIMLITRRFQPTIKKLIFSLNKFRLMIICLLGLALSFIISQYWRLDMACNQIVPIVPICIGVISGISFIISFSILVEKSIFFISFTTIGRNTYEIMALSQVIISTLKIYLNDYAVLRYCSLIIILIIVSYIRKNIEGRFSKQEAI